MKTRRFFSVLLAVCLACCLSAPALAAGGDTLGVLNTAPGIYDLTFVLPAEMTPVGSTQDFNYGFYNECMMVGITLNAETDFDTFFRNRFADGFATESTVTIGDFEARRYTPIDATGIYAIYAIQSKAGAGIVDIAFYPLTSDDVSEHEDCIRQVLDGIRRRSDMLTQDFAAPWTGSITSSKTMRSFQLPDSMIMNAKPMYTETEFEFINDYLNMLVYAYDMSMDEYIQEYNMNDKDYHVTEETVNGVNVRISVPTSADISTDLAFVAVEGENGRLMEMVFGAMNAAEADANWQYVNAIIDSIH